VECADVDFVEFVPELADAAAVVVEDAAYLAAAWIVIVTLVVVVVVAAVVVVVVGMSLVQEEIQGDEGPSKWLPVAAAVLVVAVAVVGHYSIVLDLDPYHLDRSRHHHHQGQLDSSLHLHLPWVDRRNHSTVLPSGGRAAVAEDCTHHHLHLHSRHPHHHLRYQPNQNN
jgi:ABC-type nickel/cobalt efflux system permease component RcnA